MDILTVDINKIHSVKNRGIFVETIIDTDCWGCKRTEQKVFFFKNKWERRISGAMQYKENDEVREDMIAYYENMKPEEYIKRFEPQLKDFTDEEIVEELNRRLKDKVFHHIEIKCEANVIVNRR